MPEKVLISFEDAYEGDSSPMTIVFNPSVLPFALFSQVGRFGLVGAANRKSAMTGRLKGDRAAFTQMIQSYGVEIEIVHGERDSITALPDEPEESV